jgi:hypothetical protein
MDLTQYKDILGKPRQGFHKARLFGLARNDLIGTAVIALLISHSSFSKFMATFLLLIIIGVYLHWIFGVDSTLLRWLKDFSDTFIQKC